MPSLSLIIPLYYCDESLWMPIELCFSTLHLNYPDIEPYVIDDASPLEIPTDWPIEETNAVNLGYVATVNKGLRNTDGDIIVVANDDLQFPAHCLDRFFDLPDGVIAFPADSASGSTERFGAIWGMTRATFNELGFLDERYRNYFADSDYYDRAVALGIEMRAWPDIILPHTESATFKTLDKESLFAADKATFDSTH